MMLSPISSEPFPRNETLRFAIDNYESNINRLLIAIETEMQKCSEAFIEKLACMH